MKHTPTIKQAGQLCLAVTLAIAVSTLTGCGSEEQSRAMYEDLKSNLGVQDRLTEGEIEYGFFSGKLVVESPELRLPSAGYSAPAGLIDAFKETYLRGANNVQESMHRALRNVMSTAIYGEAGLFLISETLVLSSKGDKEDGTIDIYLKGISLRDPYVAKIAGDLVPASDLKEELVPSDAVLDNVGKVHVMPRDWQTNALNRIPGIGNGLINASGAFGATLDANLIVERASSGEGEISLKLTHRIDGSEIGSITRKALLSEMPDLDSVMIGLGDAAKAFAVGTYSTAEGSAILAIVLDAYSRKVKASSYEVNYDGYGLLEAAFNETGLEKSDKGFAEFCDVGGISFAGFLAKSKMEINDADCAVARSMIENGSYSERYSFNDDKSLFSELMVNSKYAVQIN